MLRIASVLLVAVLLTTCIISGAFAKYVTKDTDNDSARVAKWGVTVEIENDAFTATYATDDEDVSAFGSSNASKCIFENVHWYAPPVFMNWFYFTENF